MPTVMAFDNPALVATLAANAGQYAQNDQQRQGANQLAQAVMHSQAQQQQAQQFAQDQQLHAYQIQTQGMERQREANMMNPMAGGTEIVSGSQNPGGFVPGPGMAQFQQAMHGGGGATGHLPMQQQAVLQTIEKMRAEGMLSDEEYMRYKGEAMSGGNPLSKPTERENNRALDAKRQMTDAQQAALDQRDSTEQDRMDVKSYERERNALKDQIESKSKRLNSMDGPGRKALLSEITDLEKKLGTLGTPQKAAPKDGAGPAPAPGSAAGYVQQVKSAAPTAPGGRLQPLPRSKVSEYLKAAGFNKQAAMQAAAADGFDPNNIIEG